MTSNDESKRKGLKKEARNFHSIFNENAGRDLERLEEVKSKLQIQDDDNECEEETIAKLNLATWIEFRLRRYDKAKEHNDKVIKQTNGNNMTSLLAQFYILMKKDDIIAAGHQLKKIKELQKEEFMNKAIAELAYSFVVLGGAVNISRAIKLYTPVVKLQPENFFWKYRLGLAHRRALHRDMFHAITSGLSIKEHAQKAAELFFDTENEPVHFYLRGRAFSQLAVMMNDPNLNFSDTEREEIFRGHTLEELIDDAFEYGKDDAWTMTECARVMKEKGTQESFKRSKKLFKKALELKKHTTTCHQLGLCYKKQAYDKDICKKQVKNEGCSTTPCSTLKDDLHVIRAIHYFQMAIHLSMRNNIPALKDLGQMLMECGDFKMALEQFEQVIATYLDIPERVPKSENKKEMFEYVSTVTHAYEQSGICLYKLAGNPGVSEKESSEQKDEAERKLMIAVSLAARMSNIEEHMQNYKHEVWKAFSTLEAQYEASKESPKMIKMYLELLHRVAKFEKILEVVERLRGLEEKHFADPNVINIILEALLASGKYEKAYTVLSVTATGPLFDGQRDPLTLKVCLYAAASRLQASDNSAGLIFKPLFEHFINANNKHPSQESSNDQVNKHKSGAVKSGVLLVYNLDDENIDVETKMKDIFLTDFGLHTLDCGEEILSGRIWGNELIDLIVESRLSLCLLSKGKQSSYFDLILGCIPRALESCPGTSLLVGLLDDEVKVPHLLMNYRHLPLKDILNKIHDLSKHIEEDQTEELNQCVQAKMSLFCSVIDKKWPP